MPIVKPRPDDDLLRLARRHGVRPEDLKVHDDNRDIFDLRSTAVLHEDDEILVPDDPPEPRRVESGKSYVLVYAPPDRVLELELLDDDGRPLNVDYTLQEIEYDDTAEGNEPTEVYGYAHRGQVFQRLPPAALRAKLVIDGQEQAPIALTLGRLDPVTKRSGLLERLGQLGLYMGPRDGSEFDARVHHAIRVFQKQSGLTVTGQADAETRAALVRRCGA